MQTTVHIGSQEIAAILAQSVILNIDDLDGLRKYTLTTNELDVLLFTDGGCGNGFAVYPDSAFDADGGSEHDQARAILADDASA